jgi:Zn-finger nucleic acid-binding protein
MRMFISRQREYRADAISVRLTRDPLSLAEALYAIGYRWRGGGLPAQELESIFIVNPVYSALDEREGPLAFLFSTHPPIDRRLGILLDMAHSDVESVVKDIDRQAQKPRTTVPEVGAEAAAQWMVHKDGSWQGPLTLTQLAALGRIGPETWIQRVGSGKVQMAYQDPDVRDGVIKRDQGAHGSAFHCPKCAVALNIVIYEGMEVHKCASCRGTLISENDIQRIIIRREVGFSDKIKRIAEGLWREEHSGRWQVIDRAPETLLSCPKCRHPKAKMLRMFYTEVYRVEVDKCFTCGLIWFDGDELEVLQYLIEESLRKAEA